MPYTEKHHPSLRNNPCDIIGGRVVELAAGGIVSRNPARPGDVIWHGSPRADHVDLAVAAAKAALPGWAATPREERFAILRRFAEIADGRKGDLTTLLVDEVGKPEWDAAGEAGLIGGKVGITLAQDEHAALHRVTEYEAPLTPTRRGVCSFRPHGVMAVIAPFNFPAHLPNGHIVPALAMGNTIVLKPSDKTPAVGQMLAEMLLEAGFPEGVINLVQGGGDIAGALTSHRDVDGVLFTGSWQVGRKILEANLDDPHKIVALEMGGNNAAVVMDDADLRQAVIECVRAAFITTGQRCTCTRRIIVQEGVAQRFIDAFVRTTRALRVGDPRGEEGHPVFMGPIINDPARQGVMQSFRSIVAAGGETLVEMTLPQREGDGCYITPGAVRVPRFTKRDDLDADPGADVEVFGPLARIAVVRDLSEAIEQANATKYGLAASIFTTGRDSADRFLREAKAGCVNVNTGTAGASSKLPFGGLGLSGNHRPAGAFSLDYCAYPVASMIETGPDAPLPAGMAFEESWVR